MPREIKKTVVGHEVYSEEEFSHPSSYYIVDCLGNRVYYKCRDRALVQQEVDKEYGKGKYAVKAAKTEKGGGSVTCRGFSNSKSLAGTRLVNIRNGQGRGI